MTVKGTTVPADSSLRNTVRTRAWENITLKQVLEQIAKDCGMATFYDAPGEGRVFKCLNQRSESDSQFLSRLADENGISFKATAGKLVFFGRTAYEAGAAIQAVDANSELITSLSLTAKTNDVYTSCTIVYWDASTQEKLAYTYNPKEGENNAPGKTSQTTGTWSPQEASGEKSKNQFQNQSPNKADTPAGKPLLINRRVEDKAQLEELAKKELHNHNRRQVTGKLSMLGNPLAVGQNINIMGAGRLDGKYHITKGTHKFDPKNGYSSTFEISLAGPEAVPPRTNKDGTGRQRQLAADERPPTKEEMMSEAYKAINKIPGVSIDMKGGK